jgi:GxxExxY protein
MVIELRNQGLSVQAQLPIAVHYCDVLVGDFVADLVVEGCVLVELKAVDNLHTRHEAQLVNYLVATGVDVGLLINFGTSVAVKRKHRTYTPA